MGRWGDGVEGLREGCLQVSLRAESGERVCCVDWACSIAVGIDDGFRVRRVVVGLDWG